MSRSIRFVRSLWDKELRGFVVFNVVYSLVFVGFVLTTGRLDASWLPVPLGLWGGLFSVCAVFRLFGWSESKGKLIFAITAAAVVAMWLGQDPLFGVGFSPFSPFPPTPAGFAYRTAWIFLIGFGAPAPAVARVRFGHPYRP